MEIDPVYVKLGVTVVTSAIIGMSLNEIVNALRGAAKNSSRDHGSMELSYGRRPMMMYDYPYKTASEKYSTLYSESSHRMI